MKRLDHSIKAHNTEQIEFQGHWYDRGFEWEILSISDRQYNKSYMVWVKHAGQEDGWYPIEFFDIVLGFEERVC